MHRYNNKKINGNLAASGTDDGRVKVWDAEAHNLIKIIQGQPGRVGALSWHGDVSSSGSEDGIILSEHDGTTPSLVVQRTLLGHQGRVSRK